MDPRLLQAYNEELEYLREGAREFGEEYPVQAGQLGLGGGRDKDPYVERLLEGVAFLAARVRLKQSDQFPAFTQHLLQAIQPSYLGPTPSMGVVSLRPGDTDETLAKGVRVDRLTPLTAEVPGRDAICTFRTAHAVDLYPLMIERAEYLPSTAAIAPFKAAAGVSAEAGLRIRFKVTAGSLSAVAPASLPLFIAGSEATPGELYRQMVGETLAVIARVDDGEVWTHLPKPEPYGFADDCALLPQDGRAFRGYRLLAEYFACPERFLFTELLELDRAFASARQSCDVVLLFSRAAPALIDAVSAATLRLFCTPVVNLFPMSLGRVPVSRFEHEHLVMPDRARPNDYEVFRLLEVTAHDAKGGMRPAAPLHAFGALQTDWRDAIFYAIRVSANRLKSREQRTRGHSDYVGTETYLSLLDPGARERAPNIRGARDEGTDIKELGVRALVTNRELPDFLKVAEVATAFKVGVAKVERVDVVRALTRPRAPIGLADTAWRVIGHLTPNYASLVSDPEGSPELLRSHMALYGRTDDPSMRRQVAGVLSVRSEPVTRRVSGHDRLAFGRGLRVRIRLDDAAFENGRLFLFAAVLDRFLSEFASVNTFIETVFSTSEQGEFTRWPPRTGLRPTI